MARRKNEHDIRRECRIRSIRISRGVRVEGLLHHAGALDFGDRTSTHPNGAREKEFLNGRLNEFWRDFPDLSSVTTESNIMMPIIWAFTGKATTSVCPSRQERVYVSVFS